MNKAWFSVALFARPSLRDHLLKSPKLAIHIASSSESLDVYDSCSSINSPLSARDRNSITLSGRDRPLLKSDQYNGHGDIGRPS
jgi:hypothetical protein